MSLQFGDELGAYLLLRFFSPRERLMVHWMFGIGRHHACAIVVLISIASLVSGSRNAFLQSIANRNQCPSYRGLTSKSYCHTLLGVLFSIGSPVLVSLTASWNASLPFFSVLTPDETAFLPCESSGLLEMGSAFSLPTWLFAVVGFPLLG